MPRRSALKYFEEVSTQPRQFEAEIWHAEQGSMMLEWAFKPMLTVPGVPIQYLCEGQDITWRKITEDKLFQREASLSHYYDLQPVMMLTLDEQNRIQQVNRFAEQLLGFQASQLLGHPSATFISASWHLARVRFCYNLISHCKASGSAKLNIATRMGVPSGCVRTFVRWWKRVIC